MPTSRRISVSAPRPICSMVCSTSRVEPSSTTRRSAPAWMTIIETLCATASCSSRAILARSSTTASRAATSRSRSASRARRSRSPTIRRRSSITTTVPSANPIAVLFQWAGSASRPTGDRSVSPTKRRAGHEPPARGPDGQAVQRAEPGDRPAAGRQVVPGEEVQRHEALCGHAGRGRVALAERDGRAGGDGEQGGEGLLARRARRERDLQQRDGGEDGRDDPVALPFVAQPQVHAVTVIPAEPIVIGQPDEAAAAGNRPVAGSGKSPGSSMTRGSARA